MFYMISGHPGTGPPPVAFLFVSGWIQERSNLYSTIFRVLLSNTVFENDTFCYPAISSSKCCPVTSRELPAVYLTWNKSGILYRSTIIVRVITVIIVVAFKTCANVVRI